MSVKDRDNPGKKDLMAVNLRCFEGVELELY